MRLISLDLENFRQHRKTSIAFRDGITGVIGRNGAGKTTLLEAIAWTLYGAVAVRGRNEDIRCYASEASRGVEARLSFSLDGQSYTVTRRLDPQGRPKGAELAVNGSTSRSGFTEVSESVARILGMDYRAFFNSFFTKQKELEFMAGMSGQERAKAIGRMLGYDRLTRAKDRANQDRLGLDREIKGIQLALPDPEDVKTRKAAAKKELEAARQEEAAASELLKTAEAELERVTPLKDASEQKAGRHEELSRRIEADLKEIEHTRERLGELSAEIADLEAKTKEMAELQGAVEEYGQAEKEYRELAELQKHESERQKIQGQLETIARDIEQISGQMAALADSQEELAEARTAVASVENELERARQEVEAAQREWTARRERLAAEIESRARTMEDIKARRRAIERSGPSGRCPTCERPLGDELPKVLEGFNREAAEIREQLAGLERERQEVEREPKQLTGAKALLQTLERTLVENRNRKESAERRMAELDSLKTTLAAKQEQEKDLRKKLAALPTGFDQQRFDLLRRRGAELRPKRDRALQLSAELARLPAVRAEREEKESALRAKTKEAAAAQATLKQLAFSKEEHEQMMLRFARAAEAVAGSRLNLERSRGEVKAASATLAAVEAEEESYRAKLADLKDKQARRLYLSTLTEAFDALRTELNSRIRPELEETTSEILAALTDGRYQMVQID